MTINQDVLREILKDFLKDNGITQKFISEKMGLSSNTLASFKCGAFNLSEEKAQELLNLIERLEGIC